MSVPITIPSISTPSAGSSPSSDDSSQPRTPPPLSTIPPALTLSTSPEQLNNQAPQQNSGASQMKRKPSRRANTAERRATHNAVERQRRETLNGRFLVCCIPLERYFCYIVFIVLVGPSRSASQPLTNSSSIQVCNCQLVHCSHPRITSSPPLSFSRA